MRALELAERNPHEFTLQYPRREYARMFRADVRVDPAALEESVLYVHVPFCARRCAYCNFAIDLDPDAERMERYIDVLVTRLGALPLRNVRGIDIGGGTPTRLPPKQLERLLGALARFDAPISVETTPELATTEILDALRGVDRVSVGVQSTDPEMLGSLGRERTLELHFDRLRARFRRTSLDLVFALPGQTRAAWLADVDAAIALGPDTITTYDCLYRGKGRALTRRTRQLPSPATYGALYDAAYERLGARGYHAPYGSVNFSRHPGETGTSVYFEKRLLDGTPYVGVGTYASSHAGDVWTFARAGVERWMENESGDSYLLEREDTIAKYLLLSLSFGRIDRARFVRRFSVDPELSQAESLGLLRRDAEGWSITRFADMPKLRALMYSPKALAWLSRASLLTSLAP
ncbi:MAG: coproporphyrinogen-III oxidase family protein [Polyangiales bacterium]